MHHEVRRMFADTTAPHLTSISGGNVTVHHHLIADPSRKVESYVEKVNVTSTSPFLALTSLLTDDRTHSIPGAEKRKFSAITFGECDDDEDDDWTSEMIDDGDDDIRVIKSDDGKNPSRTSNHSEIEKRRRDKMNNFITEIAQLVPSCAGLSKRMDKLSVLRLAVQHIKSLKGTFNFNGVEVYKPGSVSDKELRELIMQNSDVCMIGVNTEDTKIFHASDSVQELLGYSPEDLQSHSFLCLVHPDDVEMVKSQVRWRAREDKLAGSGNGKDKNGLAIEHEWCTSTPGCKRSFYCRIRSKPEMDSVTHFPNYSPPNPKYPMMDDSCLLPTFPTDDAPSSYRMVHCEGIVKLCSPVSDPTASQSKESAANKKDQSQPCLILAITPVQATIGFNENGHATGLVGQVGFTARLSANGRFDQIDGCLPSIVGYLPQDLVQHAYYEYVHNDDVHVAVSACQKALDTVGPITSPRPYRMRTQSGHFIPMSTIWKCFRNPWTNRIQFFIVEHSVISSEESRPQSEHSQSVNSKLTTLTQLLLRKDTDPRSS